MAATLENCSYPDNYNELTLGEQLIMADWVGNVVFGIYACSPFKWQYLVCLIAVVVWLILGRWLYDLYMRLRRLGTSPPFSLATELTKNDNKAMSVDFASYLFALCWITRGSLTDVAPAVDDGRYFASFFVYQAVGYMLILVARILNDKIMLRRVDNVKAMVEDRNIGVACAQAGATIGTAIILAASAGGVSVNFGEGVAATLLFWAIGQALLITYSLLSDMVTSLPMVRAVTTRLVKRPERPDGAADSGAVSDSDSETRNSGPTSLLKQAAAGNVAAGLHLGCDMVHAAILIAAPITVGYSLLAWIVFVAVCLGFISPLLHVYLDHIVMRGAAYSVNILRHRNWGAALLLGSLKILTSLLLASLYSQNCAVGNGLDYFECYPPKLGGSLGEKLANVAVPDIFDWQSLLDLLMLLAVILFAKGVFFLRFACRNGLANLREGARSFSLDAALADPKNNAIAISLAAYSVAQGLTLVGTARCPNDNAGVHAGNLVLWTTVGCLLLVLAFMINDCLLLRSISNTESLLADNVAIALFEAGSFLSCGFILRGNLLGSGSDTSAEDVGRGIAYIVLYWVITQVVLLAFAYAYRCLTSFDDYKELRENNAAAGLSGGVTLIAFALVMAYPLPYYSSLLIFLPIAIVGSVVLILIRFVVDHAVLPGDRLDSEINKDHNWGAALIEGAVTIGLAIVLNLYVPQPGGDDFDICPNPEYYNE